MTSKENAMAALRFKKAPPKRELPYYKSVMFGQTKWTAGFTACRAHKVWLTSTAGRSERTHASIRFGASDVSHHRASLSCYSCFAGRCHQSLCAKQSTNSAAPKESALFSISRKGRGSDYERRALRSRAERRH